MKSQSSGGFTLVEILTVLSILSIVSALAYPGMQEMLRNNRISGEISELVSSIQYARSEAIKRGDFISICPSNNQKNCTETSQWNTGWIIFEDSLQNGNPQANSVLRLTPGLKGGDSITSSLQQNIIHINFDGFLINLPSSGILRFNVESTPENINAKRCVKINTTGIARIHKVGQDGCD